LPAICRAAAATDATAFLQAHRVRRFAAGSRQIVSKLTPTPSGQNQKLVQRFGLQGVGGWLLWAGIHGHRASARRAWESSLLTICRVAAAIEAIIGRDRHTA
jgi:hypothetical protein